MYCTSGVCTEDGLHSIFTCPAEVMSHWMACMKMYCRLDLGISDAQDMQDMYTYIHMYMQYCARYAITLIFRSKQISMCIMSACMNYHKLSIMCRANVHGTGSRIA